MLTEVTIYYLEMNDPAELRPSRGPRRELEVVRAEIPLPELNRFLYTAVGGGWHWVDRLEWTRARWLEYLDRPEVETWVAWVRGTPAGYFELETQSGGDVEIVYLGLLPQFLGQGLGGPLLTHAVERAFVLGAARVWVHTCTLDHPAALANYRARGLRLYKEEVELREVAREPQGPWPGA